MRYLATSGGRSRPLVVTRAEDGWRVRLDDREVLVDVLPVGPSLYSLLIEGRSYEVDVFAMDGGLVVHVSGQPFRVELQAGHQARAGVAASPAAGGETIRAPMPGKAVRVLVRPGDRVGAGDGVVVIEAMKMENELKALAGGRVREVRVAEGKAVAAGEVLVVLE